MKKVLIVEDNDANLYLIRYILANMGYQSVEARTGKDAIRLAGELDPDLILMDIQLPDINGLDTTREIRRLRNGKKTCDCRDYLIRHAG